MHNESFSMCESAQWLFPKAGKAFGSSHFSVNIALSESHYKTTKKIYYSQDYIQVNLSFIGCRFFVLFNRYNTKRTIIINI